jgi:hypothetical protein
MSPKYLYIWYPPGKLCQSPGFQSSCGHFRVGTGRGQVNPQRVGIGWKARWLGSLSLPKIPIMLTDAVDNFNHWFQATNPSHSFQLFPRGADTLPSLFKLDANERWEYEILNEYHGKICGVLTVPQRVLGEEHLNTLMSISNLASTMGN